MVLANFFNRWVFCYVNRRCLISIADQLSKFRKKKLSSVPLPQIENLSSIKIAALFDIHWPDHINIKPTIRFLKQFEPDIIILGGDIWSLDCISHHEINNFDVVGYNTVIQSFWKQAREFPDFIAEIRDVNPYAKVVYITGNHERWINKFVARFKGQFEVPTIKSVLGEIGQDISFVDGFYTVGHLSFAHGDQFRKGINIARTAASDAKKTIVFGHWHTYQVYPERSCIDDEQKYLGICVPCLTTRNPGYNHGRPNALMQGFFTATVKMPSGKFSHHVQLVSPKGHFISQMGEEYE